MSSDDALQVTVSGKDLGLAQLLRSLDALGKQVDASLTQAGNRIGQAIGAGAGRARPAVDQLGQASLRASRESLSLAQTYARGQAAAGDYAGAIARLNSAMDSQSVVSVRQAAQIQNQVQAYERAAQAAREKAAADAQAGGTMGQLTGVAGQLGLALALPAAAAGAAQLARQGATAELVQTRFEQLASTAGTTGQALLGALRSASGGEIADLNLQLAANRAQMLGVADSAEELSTLMAIARDRAQSLGTDSATAFDDLVTGLGRGSPLILDNLGILVKVGEANDAYAASIGKTANELTAAEQKQALINAVLEQGRASLEATGGAAESTAGSIAKFDAAVANLSNKIGAGFASAAAPTLDVLSSLTNVFDGSRESVLAYVDAANTYLGASQAVAQINRDGATAVLDFLGVQSAVPPAVDASAAAQAANEATAQALARAYQDGTISLAQYDAAMAQLTAATSTASTATQDAGQAATDAAAQELAAAADAQLLTDAKQRLADQALAAAQAVIDGGGNIEAIAARLAASSSQVDVLTAAYLRLLAAQQAAGIAGAQRLRDQAAQTRDLTGGRGVVPGAPGRTGSGDPNAVIKFIEDQKRAAAATRDQQYALADQAGQARILEGELANLTPGTEAYIRKQTELLRLQQGSAGGRGGGGRAGAQAREEAALLKGQQDYQQKSLDAEREYQEDLAQIAEDGAKARKEAEDQYNLDRRRSKVSFYQSLAGIEDQDLARELSARYEQAAQEAQRIAQEQGADAAKAYLEAQQQAIEAQGQLQQQIADAEAEGDAGKAEYYRGLLALQQEADAEELRQIQEQGSAIAAAENAQYAEAERRYAEHLERMGIAYERKFGGAPPGLAPPPPASSGGGSTGGTATGGAAATGAATGTATAGGATLVAAPDVVGAVDAGLGRVEAAVAGLGEGLAAVERRVGQVESAVRGLRNSGVVGG